MLLCEQSYYTGEGRKKETKIHIEKEDIDEL